MSLMWKGANQEVNFRGMPAHDLVDIDNILEPIADFPPLTGHNNMVLAIRAKAARTEDPEDREWNILVKSLAIGIGNIQHSAALRSLHMFGYRLSNMEPVITNPVEEPNIEETSGIQIATSTFEAVNARAFRSQLDLVNVISPENRANYPQGFGGFAVGLVFEPFESPELE